MRSMTVFNFLLEATVIGSVIILMVIAVRALLRDRLGSRAIYAAWLLVALRLLLPLSLPNPVMDEFRPGFSVDVAARPVADQVRQRVIDASYSASTLLDGVEGGVFGLIEHNAELIQPLDGVRSFHNKATQQFRAGSEVAAAERVEVMLNRGIVLFIGSLNAAFCHHRVRITDAQLCHDHDLRTCVVRLNSCGSTCAAAADDEHVGVVIDLRATSQTEASALIIS